MENDDIIGGLCDFYQEVDEVHSKYNNRDITPEQAIKEIENILSEYYKYYCGGSYGI